jgi:acyl-CoA synthetase (AMP-forming)/AMP-acid ligase II/acyl carrier protein
MIDHRAINRLVCNPNYVDLKPPHVMAHASSVSFDAATFEIWGALLNGIRLAIVDKDEVLAPRGLARTIKDQGISLLFLTTALFNQIARDVPDAFRSLDSLLTGGEAVDAECMRTVLKHGPPRRLVHVYGPTEVTTFSTAYDVKEIAKNANTVPIGKGISNTQAYILNAGLQAVPMGVVGELYLGGAGVTRGYLDSPELTAERCLPDISNNRMGERLYRTGDLARWTSTGNIEFIGRFDHQIKLRGFRIELAEIESVMNRHPGVKQSVVVMWQDEYGEKQLVGYFEPQSDFTRQAGSKELRNYLAAELPSYLVPAVLVELERLPITVTGKIDRTALPRFQRQDVETDAFRPPRNATEQAFCSVWSQVLGISPIGVDDDFLDLGGNSLNAIRIVSKLRREFGMDIPLDVLFDLGSIARLAEYAANNEVTVRGKANFLDKGPRQRNTGPVAENLSKLVTPSNFPR